MEQKAFYEIEKPPKKHYAVIVRQLPEKDTCQCQHGETFYNKAGFPLGTMRCGVGIDEIGSEVYECACCGVETCDAHMSEAVIHGDCVCVRCEKLSKEDMEKIVKLRLELNS